MWLDKFDFSRSCAIPKKKFYYWQNWCLSLSCCLEQRFVGLKGLRPKNFECYRDRLVIFDTFNNFAWTILSKNKASETKKVQYKTLSIHQKNKVASDRWPNRFCIEKQKTKSEDTVVIPQNAFFSMNCLAGLLRFSFENLFWQKVMAID